MIRDLWNPNSYLTDYLGLHKIQIIDDRVAPVNKTVHIFRNKYSFIELESDFNISASHASSMFLFDEKF